MASAVDIANLALSHLGQTADITDMDPPDDNAHAEYAARFYPMARNELLEMHPWTFAVRRVPLAAVAVADRSAWHYAYALPAGCIRPLAVVPRQALGDIDTDEFIVESSASGVRTVYTNTPEATLRYISLVEDTTKFSPGFVSALSRLLASKLAGPVIKGNEGMTVAMKHLQIFALELANAKVSDSASGSQRITTDFVPAGIIARGFRGLGTDRRGFRS